MKLAGITFVGPGIDDPEIFDALPPAAQQVVAEVNGFIAFDGGLLRSRTAGWPSRCFANG